jgi:predicted component of type VI protein secretion system
MKRLAVLIAALLLATGTFAYAHGDNDHVRGVVSQLSATSVTVQVSETVAKTLTLNNKTTFEQSGKAARFGDLKIGDRVVIDVPKGTTEARLIKFGAPAPKKTS